MTHTFLFLPTSFYLHMSYADPISRAGSEEQSIVFDGAIKAQWSDHCFVVLFKAAKLDFFATGRDEFDWLSVRRVGRKTRLAWIEVVPSDAS